MKPGIVVLELLPVHAQLILFIDGNDDADLFLHGAVRWTTHRKFDQAEAVVLDLRPKLVHVTVHAVIRLHGYKSGVESIGA
jgi:hypothetical protein